MYLVKFVLRSDSGVLYEFVPEFIFTSRRAAASYANQFKTSGEVMVINIIRLYVVDYNDVKSMV